MPIKCASSVNQGLLYHGTNISVLANGKRVIKGIFQVSIYP